MEYQTLQCYPHLQIQCHTSNYKKYIWHPFTQMQQWLDAPQTVITDAKGIKLYDAAGKSYYDGVSSLWVNIHGHRRPEIDAAITEQLQHVAHSTALGLASVPAARLAERLVEVSPAGLKKVFYSDDGATAVEIALKMAFQYWQIKGRSKKTKFVTLQNAYHGDTIGAVSVNIKNDGYGGFCRLHFESPFFLRQ